MKYKYWHLPRICGNTTSTGNWLWGGKWHRVWNPILSIFPVFSTDFIHYPDSSNTFLACHSNTVGGIEQYNWIGMLKAIINLVMEVKNIISREEIVLILRPIWCGMRNTMEIEMYVTGISIMYKEMKGNDLALLFTVARYYCKVKVTYHLLSIM